MNELWFLFGIEEHPIIVGALILLFALLIFSAFAIMLGLPMWVEWIKPTIDAIFYGK